MVRQRIKDHIRESRIFNERAAIALAIVIIMIFVILARLVYLQIISHEHFTTLAEDNRVSIVPIPPTRGLIYDRNGTILAQNVPAFSLEIVPERVADMDQTIQALSEIIEISDDHIKRFKKQQRQKSAFRSIPLRTHLNEVEVARFAASRHLFPGVEIEARLVRDYPYSHLTAHVIGYVGRINVNELKKVDASNYSATHHIGKLGIEKFYEDQLHGTVGFKNIETNVMGRTIRTLEQRLPVPGDDLYLTIDIELQQAASKALGDHRGAAIAIDPRNGDVLAMVSQPSYDPNPFVVGIDSKSYRALQNDIDNPLFDRAGEGTGLETKQLCFHQLVRQGGAVDHQKRLFAPGRVLVDGPGGQLLADPGLTGDQHRQIGGGELTDLLAHLQDLGAGADNGLTVGRRRIHIAVIAGGTGQMALHPAGLQGLGNDGPQLVVVKGLGHVVKGAVLHGLHGRGRVGKGGDHDHRQVGVVLLDDPERGQSVHAGHADIHQNHGRGLPVNEFNGLLAVFRGQDLVFSGKGAGEGVADRLFVVNDQQLNHRAGSGSGLSPARGRSRFPAGRRAGGRCSRPLPVPCRCRSAWQS